MKNIGILEFNNTHHIGSHFRLSLSVKVPFRKAATRKITRQDPHQLVEKLRNSVDLAWAAGGEEDDEEPNLVCMMYLLYTRLIRLIFRRNRCRNCRKSIYSIRLHYCEYFKLQFTFCSTFPIICIPIPWCHLMSKWMKWNQSKVHKLFTVQEETLEREREIGRLWILK